MHHPVSPRDMARRMGVLILALLQFAAAGLVPLADAGPWTAGVEGTLHVESSGNQDCPTPHDHLFCQLCRTLAMVGIIGPAQPASLLARPCLVSVAGTDLHGAAPWVARSGSLGSRAPPLS